MLLSKWRCGKTVSSSSWLWGFKTDWVCLKFYESFLWYVLSDDIAIMHKLLLIFKFDDLLFTIHWRICRTTDTSYFRAATVAWISRYLSHNYAQMYIAPKMATYRSSLPGSKLGKAFFFYIIVKFHPFLNFRLFLYLCHLVVSFISFI